MRPFTATRVEGIALPNFNVGEFAEREQQSGVGYTAEQDHAHFAGALEARQRCGHNALADQGSIQPVPLCFDHGDIASAQRWIVALKSATRASDNHAIGAT